MRLCSQPATLPSISQILQITRESFLPGLPQPIFLLSGTDCTSSCYAAGFLCLAFQKAASWVTSAPVIGATHYSWHKLHKLSLQRRPLLVSLHRVSCMILTSVSSPQWFSKGPSAQSSAPYCSLWKSSYICTHTVKLVKVTQFMNSAKKECIQLSFCVIFRQPNNSLK